MIEVVYIEDGVREHPKTLDIIERFPAASIIGCGHYKEVFNPAGQNFRLQKRKPALILARQEGKLLHPIPPTYGVGGTRNFYFSHLLNCLYDCRYCFLQGMYPSAHFVHFVNSEDFKKAIEESIQESSQPSWFFSGYDCDSLAMESVTGFAQEFLAFFKNHSSAWLELRTKSTNLKVLEKFEPMENVVVAFSFTPDEISRQTEWKVPSLQARIKAMQKTAKLGWKVGWRIDPVIDCTDFEVRYARLFDQLLDGLSLKQLHSVSLGAFRMPIKFFKKMDKLYPNEHLFAGKLEQRGGMTAYEADIEKERLLSCERLLLDRIPEQILFSCKSPVI